MDRTLNWNTFFNSFPDEHAKWNENKTEYVFPEYFLPFIILKVVGGKELTEEMRRKYSIKENSHILKNDLFEIINTQFENSRSLKEKILKEKGTVIQRIKIGTETLVERIVNKNNIVLDKNNFYYTSDDIL